MCVWTKCAFGQNVRLDKMCVWTKCAIGQKMDSDKMCVRTKKWIRTKEQAPELHCHLLAFSSAAALLCASIPGLAFTVKKGQFVNDRFFRHRNLRLFIDFYGFRHKNLS
jgi:hypothetical protein